MDLDQLNLQTASETPIEVKLMHPGTGKPLLGKDDGPIKWFVYGRDSIKWDQVVKALKARYKTEVVDEDDLTGIIAEVLAGCSVRWEGEMVFGGKVLKCTTENMNMIITTPGLSWIAEQVLKAAGDRGQLFLGEPND